MTEMTEQFLKRWNSLESTTVMSIFVEDINTDNFDGEDGTVVATMNTGREFRISTEKNFGNWYYSIETDGDIKHCYEIDEVTRGNGLAHDILYLISLYYERQDAV